jgi:hypothetical protein
MKMSAATTEQVQGMRTAARAPHRCLQLGLDLDLCRGLSRGLCYPCRRAAAGGYMYSRVPRSKRKGGSVDNSEREPQLAAPPWQAGARTCSDERRSYRGIPRRGGRPSPRVGRPPYGPRKFRPRERASGLKCERNEQMALARS